MSNNKSENIILLGSSGSLGGKLKELLKKDFKKLILVDLKKDSINSSKSKFVQYDLTQGLPHEVINFIHDNADSGISLINCIGKISSQCFLSLKSSSENHKELFNSQIEALEKDFYENFHIPIALSTQFANLLINARGFGSIINFSSVSSYGNPGQLGYSSSKAALEVATKVLSREFGPLGIRSNIIAPGFIESESMRENMTENSIKKIIQKTSLKKIGDPYDIYHAVSMLINCEFINGQVLRVDGDLRI